MRLYLIVTLFLAGCATAQLETKGYWEPRNALHWDGPRVDGVTLNYEDGSTRHIAAQVIDNLLTAHERIAKASGMGWITLRLVDVRAGAEPVFHAFMTREQGGPAIGMSLGLLEIIGNDPDALAAVLGHEMAHVFLGHNEAEVKAREEKLQKSQQVGAGLVTGPAAVAALIFRVGAMVHYRSLSRDEERAADERGLQWAVKAGFDPCGMARALEATRSLGLVNVPFFSTHPGGGERRELANRYSREVNNRDCPEPGTAAVVRAGEAARPELVTDRVAENAVAAPEPSEAEKRYAAGMAAARAGDFVAAVGELRSAVDAGYAPAQAALGYWHLTGFAGVAKDEVEGGRLTRLAANQGHAGAQVNLGRMYLRGSGGVEKDAREAVRLFRLSAQQGNRSGEANLGVAYMQGIGGLDRDPLQAARYFNRAAEKGDPYAQANLGWIYWAGAEGIPKDAVEAVRLFRLAAEQNNPSGQAGLARMYLLGAGGLERDEVEALRLNRLAAEQGDAMAQNNLGAMRQNGQGGLPKDVEEAVIWYRRAAAQGNRGAIDNLKRLGRDPATSVEK
jgi:TPR repeat protein/Zn-dependent protease with chaperone function